jgi:hypothetical protein
MMAACVLCYTLSGSGGAEAIFLPVSVLVTLVLCVILYTRAEAHQRWEAAWDRYSDQDLSRKSFKSVEEEGTVPWWEPIEPVGRVT